MDGMIEAQEASVCSAANPNGVPSGDALHSIESNGADLSMAENEPRLSYAAFGADVPAIVAADSVTRLCVSDKVLALGTESGQVHILDLEGNKIKTYTEHTTAITDLSFDENAENLASSSSDGSIVVVGLYSDEVRCFPSSHPVTSIALDPRWASRKTKELIYGTSTGSLLLVSKGWLGNTETVLFQGRTPVTAVRMAGTLLAWATDTGVRVYDTSNHARVGKIDPPPQLATHKGTGRAVATLEWASRRELLVGWGLRVLAVDVVPAASPPVQRSEPNSPGLNPAIARFNIHIAASFDIGDADAQMVAGVATFGNQLAVLTWQPTDEVPETASNGYSTNESMRFRVYTRNGRELFADSVDLKGGLPLRSGAPTPPARLAALCPTAVHDATARLWDAQQSVGGRRAEQESDQPFKWWPDGADPLYFIVSEKDVVLGRPRDGADRIAWLSSKERFNEALEVADSDASVGAPARQELAEQYLRYLVFDKQQYSDAAAVCPRLLGRDAAAWERWVYVFGQASKLPVLAPFLPVSDPTLSPGTYDLAALACLRSRFPGDHARLVSLVESWPAGGYDAVGLLDKIRERLQMMVDENRGDTKETATGTELRRAGAALLTSLGRHAEALQVMVELRSLSVFDYIRRHALTAAAGPLAAGLIKIDEVKAISLLADAPDEARPEAIVRSLSSRIEEENRSSDAHADSSVWSGRLYRYLDWLWRRDAVAAAPFAEVHVRLCATHDPGRLLHLLATSTSYPLDAALEVCEAKGLIREAVYVLGRMGSSDAALRLIVGQLRDVEGALDFVAEQHDPQLWELLVSLTLGDAALVGELLDCAGGGLFTSSTDPARLVAAVPEGMAIENLRDRLVRLIREFRRTVSLQEGCNAALRSDCLELADKLYTELTRALREVHLLRAGDRWMLSDPSDASGGGQRLSELDALAAAKGVWVQPPRTSAILRNGEGFTPPASVHASPSKFPSPRVAGI